MKCEACDNMDYEQPFCEGCDCCVECCNCSPSDCDCDLCMDRRRLESDWDEDEAIGMNMVAAAAKTLEMACFYKNDIDESYIEGCNFEHLEEMVAKLEQNKDWSDGKKGRWLGWMQAVVVMATGGAISLEDMKEVNREFADD